MEMASCRFLSFNICFFKRALVIPESQLLWALAANR